MSDSRERFEAHLEVPDLMAERDGDQYVVPFIQRYWEFWQAAEANMQSDINAERIKRECAERRVCEAIRRCAEIADSNWEIEARIRAEFPESFK